MYVCVHVCIVHVLCVGGVHEVLGVFCTCIVWVGVHVCIRVYCVSSV